MSEQFDPKELKDAIAVVGTAFDEFKKTNDARLAEIETKGAADPLLDEKLAKIDDAIAASQAKLEAFELAQKRQARIVTDANGNEIDLDAKAHKWAVSTARHTGASVDGFGYAEQKSYDAAFCKLARKSFNTDFLTDVERKALSVGSASDGGYFVTPDMSGRTIKQVYETSAMRAYASTQAIGTDTLEGYYDNDEVGYGWVAELEARPVTSTPTVGKWTIPVHDMYAMPKASQKLIDDAELNVEAWLSAKIADKFARGENEAFVTGTGVGEPRGFLDYPDGTDLTNSIERHTTGSNGAFADSDVIIDALYDLKAQYRANANWFMNTSSMATVRKLKDSNGDYLWSPGIAAGQPATLIGYGVAVFEDMPDIATGSLSVAVGDMRSAYQIVDRIGIRMLRDPFSSKPSVLFYATKRTGGDMINGEALKLIEFSS